MANLHNTFIQYCNTISLSANRKKKLIKSRKAVETSILDHFKNSTKLPVPKFYIQGSYKMDTIITKKDNTHDVDLGVYFLTKPDILPRTIQKHVVKAVEWQTKAGAEHKEKCVRVIYQGEFDIDLPVYYFHKNAKHPQLATKNGWESSDPKELIDWFSKKKDKKGQLLRIIKYLKSWANSRSHKMPSGIALTVWAAENYKKSSRDDVALLETLKSINKHFFWNGIECINPATPKDDLISKLDSKQKKRFKSAIERLISDGEIAIKESNNAKAFNLWKQHFNKNRFLLSN